MGFTGRMLQGEIEEIRNITLPAIAFWRGNHFVVITRADARGVTLNDPATGVRFYRYNEAATLFSGYVLELKPGNTFEKKPAEAPFRLMSLAQIITHLSSRQRVLFILSVFCLIILLISPSYIQLILDQAVSRNDFDLVILLTFIFFIVFTFDVISKFLKQILEICMRNFAYDEISQSLRNILLQAQPSYFRTRPAGVILAIEKSLHACAEFISNGFVAVIYSALIAVCSLVFMLLYNVNIALITMLFMLLFFAIRFTLIAPWQRAVDNSITETAGYESLLVEIQKGIVTVKANNMEIPLNSVADNMMRRHISALMKKEQLLARFDVASLAVINIEQLVVVCYGAWCVLQGQMTIGVLIAYLSYKRYFADSTIQIMQKLLEKSSLQGPLERIGDLISYPREQDQFSDRKINHIEQITFDNVSFAWPGKSATLKNISLVLNRQQETVITGISGSGKTTFLRLISAILTATSGEIRINQHPLASFQLSSLRQRIRIVHADDTLFSGTIAENIACFASQIDPERIADACRMAEIDHIVNALPHAYDTRYIPGSPWFSAGELQRLILARALYSSPDWLLCDEVTANLDKVTAEKVLQNLRDSHIGLVFVTHAPELVYRQGQLLKLEGGMLLAQAGEQPAEGRPWA